MKEESCLADLKKKYKDIQKKYDLPEFDELNKDFSIEKISDTETDYLLREVRRFISDKSSNYLRFIETLLNPVNAQMFIFSVVKTLGDKERKSLREIYRKLAKNEVNLIKLDVEFDEESEVEFIKNSYEIWQEIKKDLLEVVEVIESNWDNKKESNGKAYFG